MRAFVELWDDICLSRYGVEDEKLRRFRYGVQVNSLGLTEQQPENNVYRILLEMLAVVLSKKARARAVQLPAWNEAFGLPRPWDQQWSLRMQQIVAHETDLLEFEDIFDGSPVIAAQVEALKNKAGEELRRVLDMGGAVKAVELGYMKRRLVEASRVRLAAIETGATTVVGVNAFTDGELSPLSGSEDLPAMAVAEDVAQEQIGRLKAWRARRDAPAVQVALAELQRAAAESRNIMEPSIACARAGVTTGEWAATLRQVFGEYRAPTGVNLSSDLSSAPDLRNRVAALAAVLGTPVRLLVGKPGLDGHSNGAEQIALRAAGCGMEVTYDGIRQTPEAIARSAKDHDVHLVGLSILSGSHVPAVREVMNRLREIGMGHVPVVVGGIIPARDIVILKQCGAAAVYTPRDFAIDRILTELISLIEERQAAGEPRRSPDPARRRQSAPQRSAAPRRRSRR